MNQHTDIRRTLLILRDGEKILLAMKKRGFGAGKWNGVGGKLEPGETVEQAMIRECQEEIGVTPIKYHQVAEHDFIQDCDSPDPWHMYVYAYICDEWQGTPEESEEMAPQWFSVDDIPYDSMWDDDRFWLPQVIAGEKIIGKFTFNELDKMINHQIKIVDNFKQAASQNGLDQKIAFFDIDGTLFRWQLLYEVTFELAEQKLINKSASAELKDALLRWQGKQLSWSDFEQMVVESLVGHLPKITPAELEKTAKIILERSGHRVHNYTLKLVKKLKAEGYFLLAVTGAPQIVAEPFARRYGFDDCIGVLFEMIDGKFTGKVERAAYEHKKELILDYVKQHDYSLNGSLAIGDSSGDIKMLELAEQPIAFNPDEKLLAAAKNNNWEVVIERKNIAYQMEMQNEQFVLAETIIY